jgi:cytochrome c peroxidase
MHSGQLATLAEVISFYVRGGGDVSGTGIVKDPALQPLELSTQDQDDLVEFLNTLTGEPISAALLSDTSK